MTLMTMKPSSGPTSTGTLTINTRFQPITLAVRALKHLATFLVRPPLLHITMAPPQPPLHRSTPHLTPWPLLLHQMYMVLILIMCLLFPIIIPTFHRRTGMTQMRRLQAHSTIPILVPFPLPFTTLKGHRPPSLVVIGIMSAKPFR